MDKKTIFSVEIYRNGKHNDSLIKMVTNHNEGLVTLTFAYITNYLHARFCEYPTIMPKVEMKESVGSSKTLEIIEDDKPTILITQKTVTDDTK